ncbi:DUF2301 domain-containing membrane protein [uncultured Vibrio sp.]|uniref:DUF2301 domain-containing membrane protein n=1 Tax=uncultured Vibrio sp. TaxID=114054 RepID=UPI0025EA476B|nr:DUF2301 domain-containing membrane protein [uncultured Vibrio sp.]
MANPEHREPLDKLDKISVIGYRIGIALFSLSSAWYCLAGFVELSWGSLSANASFNPAFLFSLATALSAANLHVYDKTIRGIITYSGWIGIVLLVALSSSEMIWCAYGFIFVTFSGIALKESFCFNVFGLKLVPLILGLATFFMAINYEWVVLGLLSINSIVFGYLAVQKMKMPLHFDIGNKSNYQY